MTYPGTSFTLGAADARYRARQSAAAAQMDAYSQAQYQSQAYKAPRSNVPPAQSSAFPVSHWSIVLGVPLAASKAEINKAYRAKAKLAHADAGGTDSAMLHLNLARDQAIRERDR